MPFRLARHTSRSSCWSAASLPASSGCCCLLVWGRVLPRLRVRHHRAALKNYPQGKQHEPAGEYVGYGLGLEPASNPLECPDACFWACHDYDVVVGRLQDRSDRRTFLLKFTGITGIAVLLMIVLHWLEAATWAYCLSHAQTCQTSKPRCSFRSVP